MFPETRIVYLIGVPFSSSRIQTPTSVPLSSFTKISFLPFCALSLFTIWAMFLGLLKYCMMKLLSY